MTSQPKPEHRKLDLEVVLPLVILAAAFLQWSLGAAYDKTGEQVRGGIPFVTIALVACTALLLIVRRRLDRPKPNWAHILFLTVIPLGLLGLHRSELKSGIKELIQIAEIFGLAWYVFATIPKEKRFWLYHGIAGLGLLGVVLFGLLSDHGFPRTMASQTRLGCMLAMAIPFFYIGFTRNRMLRNVALFSAAVLFGLFLKNGGLLLIAVATLAIGAMLCRRARAVGLAAAVVAVVLASIAPGPSAWSSFRSDFDATHKRRIHIENRSATFAPKRYPLGGGLGEYKRTINQLKLLQEDEPSPLENVIEPDTNSQYVLTMVEAGVLPMTALIVLLLWSTLTAWRVGGDARMIALSLAAVTAAGFFTTTLGRGIGLWTGALLGLAVALPGAEVKSFPNWVLRFAIPVASACICLALTWQVNREKDDFAYVSNANQAVRQTLFDIEEPVVVAPGPKDNGAVEVGETDTGLTIVRLSDDEEDEPAAIRVEAEAFLAVTGPMQKVRANDVSGNYVLEIPDKSGKGVGEAQYNVAIPRAGRYRLLARVFWPDGCANSIRFVVNGQKHLIASGTFETWLTLPSKRTLDLAEGNAKILIQNVEDGPRIDFFELQPLE